MEEVYYLGIAAISNEPSEKAIRNSIELLEALRDLKDMIFIVLGGYWGLMKIIADRAMDIGFNVVFILPIEPREEPPRRRNSVIIRTDTGFVSRSITMCKTADILVAVGGGIGSMLEIFMAYDFWKPVVIVKSNYDTDRVGECFPEYIDSRKKARVYYVENGEVAAKKVLEILEITRKN